MKGLRAIYLGPGKLLGEFQPGVPQIARENVMAKTVVRVRLARKHLVEEVVQSHPEIAEELRRLLA